ncbi:MAG: hypothetical protein O8C63_13090 [Candidatus Methanoperedens sp.]|nr:hypothetical protein [Candidatus Methanoperedens sp.]
MKYGNTKEGISDRKKVGRRKSAWIWIAMALMVVVVAGCVSKPSDMTKNETVTTPTVPAYKETKIAIPEPTTEQILPTYNETKPLKINDTFETWSRGYFANYYEEHPLFKIINNYSDWIAFLNEQRKEESERLEGTLFPGPTVIPRTMGPVDFNNYFIISAMMGYKTKLKPEIEIKNINRLNNVVNVTIWLYNPSFGEASMSSPYHIVIVKREVLPIGNSTFVFIDTESKELGKVEVNE